MQDVYRLPFILYRCSCNDYVSISDISILIAVKTLNEIIEKDPSLGDGFKIGHSYFCVEPEKVTDKWISTVAKYEIIPLVREYWFDNVDKVKEESDKILEAIK